MRPTPFPGPTSRTNDRSGEHTFDRDELVTIDRFLFIADAEMACTTLDAAGIDAALADENIVRMSWGDAQAHGGVKLQVRRSDAAIAMEILRAEDLRAVDTSDARGYEPAMAPLSTDESCLRCGSEEIFPARSQTKTFAFALIVSFLGVFVMNGIAILLAMAHIRVPSQAFGVIYVAALAAPFIAMFATSIVPRKRCRNCNAEWRGRQRVS